MQNTQSARGPKAVTRCLRPRSVAIIGMSARPGSAGNNVYKSFLACGFEGEIHLVGRSAEAIDGRTVLESPEALPAGVDLAVFCLPAASVREAVAACVKREVGSAVIFAAGFAEAGEARMQDEVAAMARAGGLALVGPNCIGFTNNVDGLQVHMFNIGEAGRLAPGSPPAVAIVGQSGGMLDHMKIAVAARGMPVSYLVTLGNEAGLDIADFTEFFSDDAFTRVIVVYAEQIRRPREFLAACARARDQGRRVLLLHPGRTSRSRAAAASHTGALVGDRDAMRAHVEHAGVLVVDRMDELIDVAQILARFPDPPVRGPAILTASGAFVAMVDDFADELGIDFPALEAGTEAKLKSLLPAFANAANPLDVTAGSNRELLPEVTRTLVGDPNVGMLFISYPFGAGRGAQTMRSFTKGFEACGKPVVININGDSPMIAPDLAEAGRESGAVIAYSSERTLRAIALYLRYGRTLQALEARAPAGASARTPASGDLPALGAGPQPEWLGKKLLAAAGIRVPAGGLARDAKEAIGIAARIGYPVALKAQAAALTHKTEAGGVLLNIANEKALLDAWSLLHSDVAAAAPDLKLDGALVEKMAPKGIELMLGAKRDPAWGTVLMLGLGGIWVEALRDTRLLHPLASRGEIINALRSLRAASLFSGFRGTAPVDLDAVAGAAMAIGALMAADERIVEIDVNPLVAHGEGAVALDALVVRA